MIRSFFFLFILFTTGVLSAQVSTTNTWKSERVFKTPESVLYWPEQDVLVVANIAGKASEKDQNGFLSLLNTDGTVKKLRWATGLDAPKGMGIAGGFLYVTDIDRVVKINLKDGLTVEEFPVRGAQFLNDIATDDAGNVYISDMVTAIIHRIHNGKLTTFIDAGILTRPNGVEVCDNQLFIGDKGAIWKSSLDMGKPQKLISDFEFGIDGLICHQGWFIASDWVGNVRYLKKGQPVKLLFSTADQKVNAADICLIPKTGLLLVPTFLDNRVTAYQVR